MTHSATLPRINSLRKVKALARPFPATAGDILAAAKFWGVNKNTINFLKLFPANIRFENEDDFMTRSEELEIIIGEEEKLPEEYLRSNEG
jgi:hypothetical protein